MIISYSKKFIFVKSRKTAGSSVQIALSKECDENDIITGSVFNLETNEPDERYGAGRNGNKFKVNHPHPPIKTIKDFIGQAYWDDFFKFTIVRNPWDLAVSRYHWDRKFKESRNDTSIEDFRNWIKEGKLPGYDRQWQYVGIGEQQEVDYIMRYENLSSDFHHICAHLRINPPALGFHKAGYRNHCVFYTEFYDSESMHIVAEFFKQDIEKFDYAFGV